MSATLRQAAQHWVTRLASREIAEEELRDFRAWHDASVENSAAFQSEKNRWAALEQTRATFEGAIAADRKARGRWLMWAPIGGAVAAALVMVVLMNSFTSAFADYAAGV